MIRLEDNRTLEQIHTQGRNHAAQVAIKHATNYFVRENGSVRYDNSYCAGAYAKNAATHAFALRPDLRDSVLS